MKKIIIIMSLLLLVGCASTEPPEPPETIPVQSETTIPEPPEETPPSPPESVPEPEPELPPEPEIDPKTESITAILSEMTLEERVGQLFFVHCPSSGQTDFLSEYHLGGLLLFLRDFRDREGNWLTREQFTANIASYQSAGKIPLLIGVDEEGGTVVRASQNPNLFPAKRKSPQRVYAQGGMDAIRQDACEVGDLLLSCGINVNFAPVADVSTDPKDFIFNRTIGADAETTAIYITYALRGMKESGVQYSNESHFRRLGSVLKHFPGYGNNADTHTGIAVDERPYETFLAADFLPFAAGIEAGADCVLVSHNIVTCMDETLPASLSPEVHRVLREELGFEGVILTDDLAMKAVKQYTKDGSAAVLAILAGNDMIVTADFATQIAEVLAAVNDGTIPTELIDNAVYRVLSWKYELGLLEVNHD